MDNRIIIKFLATLFVISLLTSCGKNSKSSGNNGVSVSVSATTVPGGTCPTHFQTLNANFSAACSNNFQSGFAMNGPAEEINNCATQAANLVQAVSSHPSQSCTIIPVQGLAGASGPSEMVNLPIVCERMRDSFIMQTRSHQFLNPNGQNVLSYCQQF